MSTSKQGMKAHEAANTGLVKTLSMADFHPDQRMVDEALNSDASQQHGGKCDQRGIMPGRFLQPGRR